MSQLNTKEKCTLRDLIKIEIKSLTKDGYGEYRYYEYEYCAFLLKMGRKLKLDIQQKIKAKKVYRQKGKMEKEIEDINPFNSEDEHEYYQYWEYLNDMQSQFKKDLEEASA